MQLKLLEFFCLVHYNCHYTQWLRNYTGNCNNCIFLVSKSQFFLYTVGLFVNRSSQRLRFTKSQFFFVFFLNKKHIFGIFNNRAQFFDFLAQGTAVSLDKIWLKIEIEKLCFLFYKEQKISKFRENTNMINLNAELTYFLRLTKLLSKKFDLRK